LSTRQPAVMGTMSPKRANARGTAKPPRLACFARPVIMLGPIMYWCPSPVVPLPAVPASRGGPMLRRQRQIPKRLQSLAES
jgi:hypothetical protein